MGVGSIRHEVVPSLQDIARQYLEQQNLLDATSAGVQPISAREPKVLQSKSFSTVPFLRDAKFVDRRGVMEDLAGGFTSNQRMALVGLVGAGKSQIAIEYSYRLRERSPSTYIFWIYAGERRRFEQSYTGLAQRLKLPGADDPKIDSMWLVNSWLTDGDNGNWFMILDNVDDETVFSSNPTVEGRDSLITYLPQTPHGLILITSRNRQAALDLIGDVDSLVSVPEMSQKEAISLLQCRLAKNTSHDGSSELVEALFRMPLAISQAASYINVTAARMSVLRYLDLFRKNQTRFLEEFASDLRRDLTSSASNSAIGTWKISFDHIRKHNPTACETLCFLSLLHWQSIPLRYLLADVQDDEGFEDSIRPLLAFSLIEEDASGTTFSVHQLVSLAMRSWMHHKDELKEWQDKTIETVNLKFPSFEKEDWRTSEILLPHVDTILQHDFSGTKAFLTRSLLLTETGHYLTIRGDYQEGTRKIENVRAIQTQYLDDDFQQSPIIVGTIIALVSCYTETGRYRDAENVSRAFFDRVEPVLGKEHVATLAIVLSLAASIWPSGKYEEAETLARRAHQGRKALFGANDSTTLESLGVIATILYHQCKYESAERIFHELLERRKTLCGLAAIPTLSVAQGLAQALCQLGRLDDAEPILHDVWVQKSKALGEDHPSTLTSLGDLSMILERRGDMERAHSLSQQVLHNIQKKLRPNHPFILVAKGNVAGILAARGKFREASVCFQEVVRLRESSLGKSHPDTLLSRGNLGHVYLELGQYVAAESLLSQVLEDFVALHETHYIRRIRVASNLTKVLLHQSHIDRAETIACSNLELADKKLDKSHALTNLCKMNLAEVRKQQLQFVEAESLTRSCLEQIREKEGENSTTALTMMSHLADILVKQMRVEEAIELRSQMVDINLTKYGQNSEIYLDTLSDFANLLEVQQRPAKAEREYRKVWSGQKGSLGADHRKTLVTSQKIAVLLWKQGQHLEAESLNREILDQREQPFENPDSDTLNTLHDLALSLRGQRKYTEAEEINRLVLSKKIETAGPEALTTLVRSNNLAMVLCDQEKYLEAEELIRKVVDGIAQTLGPIHPETLHSMENLAFVMSSGGQFQRAIDTLEAALQGCNKLWGEDSPRSLKIVRSVVNLDLLLGKFKGAERRNRDLIARRRRTVGIDNAETLYDMNVSGTLIIHQGRYKEAEVIYRECAALQLQHFGPRSVGFLNASKSVGRALQARRDFKGAESVILEVIEGFRETLGSSHSETLMAQSTLAEILIGQKRYREAEQREEIVLAAKQRSMRDDSPSVLFSRQILATSRAWQIFHAGPKVASITPVAIDIGEIPEMKNAVMELREVLRLEILGATHPIDVMTSANSLGDILGHLGKTYEAEILLRGTLEKRSKFLSLWHPRTRETLQLYVLLLLTAWGSGRISGAGEGRGRILTSAMQAIYLDK